MNRRHVIIIGAGLTGLAAGYRLARAGSQVTIIEALEHVGGLAASHTWRGFSLDIGPHKLYPQSEEVLALLKSLLGDDLLEYEKKSSIFVRGKLIQSPLSPRDALSHFGLVVAGLTSYIAAKLRRPRPPKSYEDYMIAGFGRYLYERILRPQATKLWGPPDELAAELGRIRMPYASLSDIVLATFSKRHRGPAVNAKAFYYPRHGIGELSERLANKITEAGGSILLHRKPTAIALSASGVEVRLSDENISADALISTIAPDTLVQLIEPAAPVEITQTASKLKFRSLILLYLALAIPRLSDDHWIVFPEEQYCFNRIYEAKSFGIGSDRSNETVVAAEITMSQEQLWSESDDEILQRVTTDLVATGLIRAEDILANKIIRIKRAYPLLDLDYTERRQRVLGFLHEQPNLVCAGRSGLFQYNNMDHSLEMGLLAAEHIVEQKTGESWVSASKHFEDRRIID